MRGAGTLLLGEDGLGAPAPYRPFPLWVAATVRLREAMPPFAGQAIGWEDGRRAADPVDGLAGDRHLVAGPTAIFVLGRYGLMLETPISIAREFDATESSIDGR